MTSHRSRPCTTSSSIVSPTSRRSSICNSDSTSPSCSVCGRSVWRREKASSWRTRPAARLAFCLICMMSWKDGSVGAVVGEQQVGIADDRGQDVVEVVRDAAGELADRLHLLALDEVLLQRCAARWCRERRRSRRRPRRPADPRRETKNRAERGGSPVRATSTGRDVALAGARRGDRLAQRRVIALGHPGVDRGSRFAGARLQRRRREAGEGAVGAQDAAVGGDRSDRHRRRVEKSGEAHFGGAQVLAVVLARRAVERQRARRAGQAGAGEGDAVQQPDRQELACRGA